MPCVHRMTVTMTHEAFKELARARARDAWACRMTM